MRVEVTTVRDMKNKLKSAAESLEGDRGGGAAEQQRDGTDRVNITLASSGK